MNKRDKDLKKQFFLKLLFMCLPSSKARVKFIRKHNLFHEIGEHVLWQPHRLPMDSHLICIHNNVKIASEVGFITHDVIYNLLDHLEEGRHIQNIGCIEIMDNVMIGYGALILPNVRIGPNAIVGAGAVVTKDVPEGCVVAGNPARVIGTFEDVKAKQIIDEHKNNDRFSEDRIREAWETFYAQRTVCNFKE